MTPKLPDCNRKIFTLQIKEWTKRFTLQDNGFLPYFSDTKLNPILNMKLQSAKENSSGKKENTYSNVQQNFIPRE